MSEKADIDFVILWVDDQDPIWIEDKINIKVNKEIILIMKCVIEIGKFEILV